MKLALKEAIKAKNLGEVPVGAVLVERKTKKVIAKAHNLVKTKYSPLAHAEMLVIMKVAKKLKNERLSGLDLYVTLEPCPMCAAAISQSRIERVYFGAEDEKSGGIVNGPRIYDNKALHHKPEVYSGILEVESKEILREFFKTIRTVLKAKNRGALRSPII